MADWRQRPLKQAMLDYARIDSHYLIHIYDRLLKKLNFAQLESLYHQFNSICKMSYKKPKSSSRSFKSLCSREKEKTRNILLALHLLRDQIARLEDESVHYVLENKQMLNLAKLVPSSKEEINFKLSRTGAKYVYEIIEVIKKHK